MRLISHTSFKGLSRVVEGSCQVLRLLLMDRILTIYQAAARITRMLFEGEGGESRMLFEGEGVRARFSLKVRG